MRFGEYKRKQLWRFFTKSSIIRSSALLAAKEIRDFKMKLVILFCLFAAVWCDAELNIEDGGKYNFLYSVDDAGAHKRQESRNDDGTVSGSYSYVDANGDLRKVEYKAGGDIGFQPTGDISVDKKTAEKAEELAALAPKAPEVPEVKTAEVKIPASPFTAVHYALPAPLLHHPLPYAAIPRPIGLPYAYAAHPAFHWF
ncbi:hypothetical protein JTE90_025735 [Oedothorax gibbosus]|uniref:Cuticle protein n=1 Tax=Oedothorax gibbosus TaxID=931172 RepID=A0AAV6UVY2_9ARAC|nr:hypothetical protein JTE90_025735 [Oedothorax gibbosus]